MLGHLSWNYGCSRTGRKKWWRGGLHSLAADRNSLNARMTAITGPSLRVVIERSQIALDYHPEASGVTAINLDFDDKQEVDRTLNLLVPGAHPTGRPATEASLRSGCATPMAPTLPCAFPHRPETALQTLTSRPRSWTSRQSSQPAATKCQWQAMVHGTRRRSDRPRNDPVHTTTPLT